MDTLRNTMSYRSVSISYGNHSESDLMIFGCVRVKMKLLRGRREEPGNEATFCCGAGWRCVLEKIIKRESRVVVANGRTGGDREVPKQPAR